MAWSFRAILSLLVASWAPSAFGYPTPVDFDGSLMRWDIDIDSPPVTYEIKADDDQDLSLFGGLIDDSAAKWTDVPSSYFAFAPVEPGETAQVTISLVGAADGAAHSAGYAVFDSYDETNPLHCSIYITIDQSVTFGNLAKTVLHELGHCAGLGHTLIPEAIMSYSLDKNGFELDVDDEAALTRLYPADGSKPKLPPGCAVGGAEAKASAWVFFLMILPLGFTLISALEKRRLGPAYSRPLSCREGR